MNDSNIDKNRIDAYQTQQFRESEDRYLANLFTQEENVPELEEHLAGAWRSDSGIDNQLIDLEHVKEEINQKIKTKERKTYSLVNKILIGYSRIAAILLIPILIYQLIQPRASKNPTKQVEAIATLNAPQGSRIHFTLPDGSKGWLNSGSTISYPIDFQSSRLVKLKGEAFFSVKHVDDNTPFEVKTRDLTIHVLGTEFNIAAYEDEPQVDVTLEKGKIQLTGNHLQNPIEMKPDQLLSYNRKNDKASIQEVDASNFSSWKEGKLVLRNVDLDLLAKQLSRWYNVDVNVENPLNVDLRYRATFKDEGIGEVLRLLKLSSKMDYQIKEREKLEDGSYTKRKITLKIKEQ